MSNINSAIKRISDLRAKMRSICVTSKESERQKISVRMSRESIKISTGTKWSEKGFVPSFKNTDEVLMEAARQTYDTCISQKK